MLSKIVRTIKNLSLVVLVIVLLTSCGKNYSDYDNTWVSEDEKVALTPKGIAKISYDGIDLTKNINVFSDSGKTHLIFCYGDKKSGDCSKKIWEADAEIKNNKLYLKIVDDEVTGLEGEIIILEQSKK